MKHAVPPQIVHHVHVERKRSKSFGVGHTITIRVEVNCPACGESAHIQPIRLGTTYLKCLTVHVTGTKKGGLNVASIGHCSNCGCVVQLTWRCFKQALRQVLRENKWKIQKEYVGW